MESEAKPSESTAYSILYFCQSAYFGRNNPPGLALLGMLVTHLWMISGGSDRNAAADASVAGPKEAAKRS